MKQLLPLFGLMAALILPARAQLVGEKPVPTAPKMEVVFAIDTTGSMGGLIAGAKSKIWSIVNEIVTAKPRPDIRVGFVAYRDKGDAYVTQVHPLTDDLDKAFSTLQTFEASGGGDGPEHVNAGLHDAVEKVGWSAGGSANQNLYQVIFLVGDFPPHLDYDDGLDYKTDVAKAANRGIFVNAIRCGPNLETEKIWLDIAKRGHGSYFTLAQNGGTVEVPTPYDDEMIRTGAALELTTIARADATSQLNYAKSRAATGMGGFGIGGAFSEDARVAALPGAPLSAAAAAEAKDKGVSNYIARQSFNAQSGQIYGAFDMVTQIQNGRKFADIKEDEWPAALKKMTPAQREVFVKRKIEERVALQKQLSELGKKRDAFLQAELKKNGGKDGFDQKMLETFKTQAATRGFVY